MIFADNQPRVSNFSSPFRLISTNRNRTYSKSRSNYTFMPNDKRRETSAKLESNPKEFPKWPSLIFILSHIVRHSIRFETNGIYQRRIARDREIADVQFSTRLDHKVCWICRSNNARWKGISLSLGRRRRSNRDRRIEVIRRSNSLWCNSIIALNFSTIVSTR